MTAVAGAWFHWNCRSGDSMVQNKQTSKRGVFFSMDALFALFVVLSLISMLSLFSFDSSSQEMTMLSMHSQAGDAIDVLAKTTLGDIGHEQIARHLYSEGLFAAKDRNKTLLDAIGTLWASNDTTNISLSSNVSRLIGPLLPANTYWAFLIDNDTIYNSSTLGDGRFVSGVSRRLASGYKLSEPVIGYVSRAFLSTLRGRQAAAYAFFGGFVGQGNLTIYVRDIPGNSSIQDLYVELNLGSDADLYVNGNYCESLIKSPGAFTVDNWTLNSCLGSINPGADNAFQLYFTGSNQSLHFLGGGFIKVTYNTDQMAPPVTSNARYYFPGINGVINLYDSFYVPGNISAMTAYMHFRSNQQAFLNLGNHRIMTALGNDSVQIINLGNAQLDALLDYQNLSSVTVPLRMGIFANGTGEGNMSNADVILITDVSGSMAWRIGYDDSTSGQVRACNDSKLFQSDTQRLALAKCVDGVFIDSILNTPGPRIGLVSFSDNANSYESLTNNGAYLKGRVDLYSAGGGTCICCAINRAYNILNSQSYTGRTKYIVVMTDGIAGNRCTNIGGWTYDDSPSIYTMYGMKMTGDTGQAVGSSGRIVSRSGGLWQTQSSPTSSTLYGIDFRNSSFGFAVGYNGVIIRWNVSSWGSQTSPTSSQLNGVSFAASNLAFAAGNGGTVARWNGSAWATVNSSTTSNLNAIDMYSSSLGFAVGASGRIIKWNGSAWSTLSSPTTQALYGISMLSPSLGFAVGQAGRIIKWNGTSWSTASSPVSDTLQGIELYNATLGFAVGANGRILVWNGSDWESDTSPESNTLYGVSFSARNLSFATGSNGDIIRWDSAVQCNGISTSGTSVCSGNSADCNTGACTCASTNAIFSAGRAHTDLNATVHAVGFGPVESCTIANVTLRNIALAGNGSYFSSSDPAQLMAIYRLLAQFILNQSFSGQITIVTGNVSTELFPDSYLAFNFTPETPALGYREISVPMETPRFPTCQGSFFIPAQFNVSDVRVTSYSSDYWTDNVSVLSDATGGVYQQVFRLADYSSNYQGLGDPFIVQFRASCVSSNRTNTVYIRTGLGPGNSSPICSSDNRAIYNARFTASVPYGPVLPSLRGHNVTVYYDLDHNGISDGVSYVFYGATLPGYNSTPVDVGDLDTSSNALDEAFVRLLNKLNFVVPSGNSGLPGSANNPIDVQLSEEVSVQVTSLSEVPYMWGPVDMGIALWR